VETNFKLSDYHHFRVVAAEDKAIVVNDKYLGSLVIQDYILPLVYIVEGQVIF